MIIKRLWAITAAAVLLLTLCSCGKKDFMDDSALLGTYSISENGDTDAAVTMYYAKTDDGATLYICDKGSGKVAQKLEFPEKSDWYLILDFDFSFSGVRVEDMNFDGFSDLYVPCSVTGENLEGMAWLWDEDEGKFVFSESLTRIPELVVDRENEMILGCNYSDGIPERLTFKWQDGRLVKQRQQ